MPENKELVAPRPLVRSQSLRLPRHASKLGFGLVTIHEDHADEAASSTSPGSASGMTPRSRHTLTRGGSDRTIQSDATGSPRSLRVESMPALVMLGPGVDVQLQRDETIESTNARLLHKALCRVFTRSTFKEIFGVALEQSTLMMKQLEATAAFRPAWHSPDAPPMPAVWLLCIGTKALVARAKRAKVFRSSARQLADVFQNSFAVCRDGKVEVYSKRVMRARHWP